MKGVLHIIENHMDSRAISKAFSDMGYHLQSCRGANRIKEIIPQLESPFPVLWYLENYTSELAHDILKLLLDSNVSLLLLVKSSKGASVPLKLDNPPFKVYYIEPLENEDHIADFFHRILSGELYDQSTEYVSELNFNKLFSKSVSSLNTPSIAGNVFLMNDSLKSMEIMDERKILLDETSEIYKSDKPLKSFLGLFKKED